MKCTEMIKKLLIEKAILERKTTRTKSMENRARLGQFETRRQAATFQEGWEEGQAFKDVERRKGQINAEIEEIEKTRKLLAKRKPSSATNTSASGVAPAANGNPVSLGVDLKPAAAVDPAALNSISGSRNTKKEKQPAVVEKPSELSWDDFYEQDEILKLRYVAHIALFDASYSVISIRSPPPPKP